MTDFTFGKVINSSRSRLSWKGFEEKHTFKQLQDMFFDYDYTSFSGDTA
jgi:hypothetical protein